LPAHNLVRKSQRLFGIMRDPSPGGILPQAGTLRQAAQAGRVIKIISFLETIADAIKGLDHLEIVVNHLEFLAQALDVAVDGAVIHVNLVVIGRLLTTPGRVASA